MLVEKLEKEVKEPEILSQMSTKLNICAVLSALKKHKQAISYAELTISLLTHENIEQMMLEIEVEENDNDSYSKTRDLLVNLLTAQCLGQINCAIE